MSGGVRLEVTIEPLEPLLFGDNRSARAGEDHALSDQDPAPSTLYGAIGMRIARQLGAAGPRDWQPARPVLGEYVADLDQESPVRAALAGYALRDAADGRPWLPRPLHCPVEESAGAWFALAPLLPVAEEAAVPSSLGAARRLAAARRGEAALAAGGDAAAPGEAGEAAAPLLGCGGCGDAGAAPAPNEVEEEVFVDQGLLAGMLACDVVAGRSLAGSARGRDSFFRAEMRAGLAMDSAANAAASGLLFTRPYRRFASAIGAGGHWSGAGFVAWYDVIDLGGADPAGWNGTGFLGGDRRRARMRFARAPGTPLAPVLDAVLAAVPRSRGWLAYLLTPAVAAATGVRVSGRAPVAAAVGRPGHLSGWNLGGGGPRPMRTVLAAGSVFFFDWPAGLDEVGRRDWIARHWLAALDGGHGTSGHGRLLIGVWR